VKEANVNTAEAGSTSTRGTRGRGSHDSVRGGRGRGTERGRGGFRGSRGGAPNGTRATGQTSVPTAEAWDGTTTTATVPEAKDEALTTVQPTTTQITEPEAPKVAASQQAPPQKTWASIFQTTKPLPKPALAAVPKPAVPPPKPEESTPVPPEIPSIEPVAEAVVEAEELPIPPVADEVTEEVPSPPVETPGLAPDKPLEDSGSDSNLAPSKDELTRDNVEHLPDTSHPPPTETAASTVASSRDIGSTVGVATPLNTSTQLPVSRPAVGGYATTALKATSGAHRSASFQRRLMEQQEAVVMPSNHAVDRAAVQFGSLGLNGDVVDSLDVDEDREEAETRPQPPQHSPVAQPRASLPPAPRQGTQAVETPAQEPVPTPKQAPGLPSVPQQQPQLQQQPQQQQQQQPSSHHSPSGPLGSQAMQNQGSQSNQQYSQFGRYGQTGIQTEQSGPPQKPYDPFGQQAPQSNQFDYASQQQNQGQSQQPSQAISSGPDSFGSQYFTTDQQRNAYQQYYQSYTQNAPSQQEAGSAQQRSGSAFGAGPADSAFPQSQQPQVCFPTYNPLPRRRPSLASLVILQFYLMLNCSHLPDTTTPRTVVRPRRILLSEDNIQAVPRHKINTSNNRMHSQATLEDTHTVILITAIPIMGTTWASIAVMVKGATVVSVEKACTANPTITACLHRLHLISTPPRPQMSAALAANLRYTGAMAG